MSNILLLFLYFKCYFCTSDAFFWRAVMAAFFQYGVQPARLLKVSFPRASFSRRCITRNTRFTNNKVREGGVCHIKVMGMLVVSLWGVNYRFSDEHPRHFYMGVSPGIKYALISLSYGPHFLSSLDYVQGV